MARAGCCEEHAEEVDSILEAARGCDPAPTCAGQPIMAHKTVNAVAKQSDCEDPDFVDEAGNNCIWWTDRECSQAQEDGYLSQAGENALMNSCCDTCHLTLYPGEFLCEGAVHRHSPHVSLPRSCLPGAFTHFLSPLPLTHACT